MKNIAIIASAVALTFSAVVYAGGRHGEEITPEKAIYLELGGFQKSGNESKALVLGKKEADRRQQLVRNANGK